jgi:hypothetical protein
VVRHTFIVWGSRKAIPPDTRQAGVLTAPLAVLGSW